jgi:hypothetical protein
MFDVKNPSLDTRVSAPVQITDLKAAAFDSRGATIFATCSDGHTRQCHLYRYGVSHEERIKFMERLIEAKDNEEYVIFQAFGGFDPKRWFGEFEVVEYTPDKTDDALRQAFKDLLNLA